MVLMLKKLEVDKNKVPAPNREEMINILLAAWKETDVGLTAVFKKLFVTNKFEGSEDFLVSDKLLSLIGDDMLELQRQLLNSEVPINLQAVIKKLVLPKGIRRKNIDGSELLDYMEGEAIFDNLESEDQSENNDQFSSDSENDEGENEADSAAIDQAMSTTMPVLVSTEPSASKSLQNIYHDPDVNKDVKFLDDLQKVFKENETSLMFKPHLNKMKAAFNKGRRSLKKQILTQINLSQGNDNRKDNINESILIDIYQEDESNIFDLLYLLFIFC